MRGFIELGDSIASRFAIGLGALCVLTCVDKTAAQDGAPSEGAGRKLEWNPPSKAVQIGGYVATGVFLVGDVTLQLALPAPKEPHWQGGILFDDAVRDALRAESRSGRTTTRTLSDVLVGSLVTYTLLADPAVAWDHHDRSDIALRMFAVTVQSFAFTSFATTLLKKTTARERPFAASCNGDPTQSQCDARDRNLSFPSGHAAGAFTAAGLICAFHRDLDLYASEAGDWAVCLTSMGVATATGLLRIAADQHYFTDVLAGAALGLLSGYIIPHFLYLRGARTEKTDTHSEAVLTPFAGPSTFGLSYSGSF